MVIIHASKNPTLKWWSIGLRCPNLVSLVVISPTKPWIYPFLTSCRDAVPSPIKQQQMSPLLLSASLSPCCAVWCWMFSWHFWTCPCCLHKACSLFKVESLTERYGRSTNENGNSNTAEVGTTCSAKALQQLAVALRDSNPCPHTNYFAQNPPFCCTLWSPDLPNNARRSTLPSPTTATWRHLTMRCGQPRSILSEHPWRLFSIAYPMATVVATAMLQPSGWPDLRNGLRVATENRKSSSWRMMYQYGGFLKWWYPYIIHLNLIFPL